MLQPYLEVVSRQISCHFKDTLGLLTAFSIFDPQKCPTDVQQLHKYGTAEMEKLLKFYGKTTEIEYEGKVFSTPADVDKTETRHEWKAFKLVIFAISGKGCGVICGRGEIGIASPSLSLSVVEERLV